ncbi:MULTISPECIES: winged helix-turn-helix domain-containing protein [unclassified Nocardia]|uniref:winged helix-turn-helix domain-containing protein n=1 Tax=unclassified Nocardia TaxID=2637762 RepID=UPI001CE3BED5|nr:MULTISPECIES: winged helix-turn-helix domain-containing protein [unclassified Nocardia]
MKRIHLTSHDLLRIRIGAPLGALGETMLAGRELQRRDTTVFAGWRSQVRRAIPENFGVLADIAPPEAHFVDLITPTRGTRSMSAGIEALHLTSRDELGLELASTVKHRARDGYPPLPSWTAGLTQRDATVRRTIATAVQDFHEVAFAGRWAHVQSYLDGMADRWARTMATEGVEALFATLQPHVRWREPVLEVLLSTSCHDEFLHGHGLVLIPSLFTWPRPLVLHSAVDRDAPKMLVIPALRDIADLAAAWGPRPANEALNALLGRTRAAALQVIADGCSTSELARQLGVSPATASEHASILREAGLIESTRQRNAMRHELTGLGAALLDGDLDTGLRTA